MSDRIDERRRLMTRVYLIRHAEAEGNLYRRIHGWYDSLITENGKKQIEALKERFQNTEIDGIYSSDRFRTFKTAQALLHNRDDHIIQSDCFREVHMGIWEDRPWGDVAYYEPETLSLFNRSDAAWSVPGSESFPAAGNRMYNAILELAEKNDGKTICIFSHGTAIKQFFRKALSEQGKKNQDPGHSDNTGISCFSVRGDQIFIEFLNDNTHLSPSISTFQRQSWWRGTGNMVDTNFRYEPLRLPEENELYCKCRREAWLSSHGTMDHYEESHFLNDANEHALYSRNSVLKVMAAETFAGILQMNFERQKECLAGWIPFYYVAPQFRRKGLGIQLLGQAISTYRKMGRDKIRLRCAKSNKIAKTFYEKHGFDTVGSLEDHGVSLYIMEKPIFLPIY